MRERYIKIKIRFYYTCSILADAKVYLTTPSVNKDMEQINSHASLRIVN